MLKKTFKITFTDGILGTAPNNEEIYRDFIASKSPDAESVESEIAAIGVDEYTEKGMTIFPRNASGDPIIYDYQIKGFFKDACGMLGRLTGKDPETGKKKKAANESGKLTAYKKVIDGLIFVEPREIKIENFDEIEICQRPLRAQTMQGERVALAISEEIPEGATIQFTVKCLDDAHMAAVEEWLTYGALRGIGQWRNSGKGRFTFDVIE